MPRKILLADDSVTAQNMGKKILSDAGYEVITVSNGSAALKKAIELLPDIAVLDVYMPGYSGLEVCKQLKDNPKTAEIPILLTVGKLEPFKSEEALKAKANAFIVKPFEATELLAVIRKIEDANSSANAKAAKKSKTASKASPEIQTFSSASVETEAPDTEHSGIEEGGWKNRLSMPRARKAEPEPEPEEEASAMGTGFRDLTPAPVEESGLRRESAFTADVAAANAPETAPATPKTDASLDISISPEEIRAIKAAVEILSGQGDNAPVLNIPAAHVEGMPRRLAPEPEESTENLPAEKTRQVAPVPEIPKVAEAAPVEAAAVKEPAPAGHAVEVVAAKELVEPAATASQTSSSPGSLPQPSPPHWKAESVELTLAEAGVSLEREMQEALRSVSTAASTAEQFNPESLRGPTEIVAAAVSVSAVPVEEKPTLPEAAARVSAQAEPAAVLAVAASASGDSNSAASSSASSSTAATSVAESQSTAVAETAEVPAATLGVLEVSAPAPVSVPVGFQDMRPPESVAVAPAVEAVSAPDIPGTVPSAAPNIDPSAPEDEIDSRTKSQMDAAWSNWRDIRNSIVTPKLTEDLAEVVAVAAGEGSGEQSVDSGDGANDASSIGNIVDSVLAEMRPKLMEEIARKLAAKKQ